MNEATYQALQSGDEVIVIASGKRYRVAGVYEPHTDEQWAENERRRAAGHCFWSTRRTVRKPVFRQVRANSKGIVGLYGPAQHLKPENIQAVQQ